MRLAPVVLFVYNRPLHTKKTIESLQRNILANESELFIFSDGPKNESDEVKVAEVRTYIKSIKNFKNVAIQKFETNRGLANSVIDGVTKIINEFNKVIVMEDDLISSPGFLKFMNEALDFYRDDERMSSISGYSFPIEIPEEYDKDVYILPRASTWGWGSWRNRWQEADWELKDFKEFSTTKKIQKDFNEGGEDLSPMLKAQFWGNIDSWGVRWSYAHFKKRTYCLYPVTSKIKNIGADNSGRHTIRTKKFEVNLDSEIVPTKLTRDLPLNLEIQNNFKKFLRLSLQRKIINKIKYDFLFKRKSL